LLDFATRIPPPADPGFLSVMFEDWVFWICLASLVLMAGRQLKRDVLAMYDWIVLATVVTPPDADDVPAVLAACGAEESSQTVEPNEVPLTVAVLTMASSSSAGPMSHPTVPIFISRHGERYHYNLQCRGFSTAVPSGIECKTLCKLCDEQRRR
jgi:hypothetical protein